MKNLKTLFFLLVGILLVATSVTSCISNSDDSLDYATQQKYLSDMAGSHVGKVRFFYPKTSSYSGDRAEYVKYDSLETSWYTRAADSSFTADAFPVYMLDSTVVVDKSVASDNAERYRQLNKAIRALQLSDPFASFKATCYIPVSSWISGSIYQFYFLPQTIHANVNFDGADHDIWFIFTSTTGQFSATNRAYYASAMLYGICIDKLQLSSQYMVPSEYLKNVIITFEGV